MPHFLALAKALQSILDSGTVVPARLRACFDEQTAHHLERTIRALSEVAQQRHQDTRSSEQGDAMQKEQEAVFSDIELNVQVVRGDLFISPEEAARRTLLIIRLARTALNADEQLLRQLGPEAEQILQQLDTLVPGKENVDS